ncbi:hypothetical protein SAVCW2_48360 [Streptomyces avermitilis]|nr:hypothetical protein SAVCW2_48360 [Streptomyces avermitilis]
MPVTAADFADSPAAFVAVTWKEYDVEAAREDTVADVPVTDWTFVPARYTL